MHSEWFKIGNIKRPAFIVCKIQDEKEMTELKGFKNYMHAMALFFCKNARKQTN
ncbi:MAG: hypothetical protein U0V03_09160 [Bacteroidia bacterium]